MSLAVGARLAHYEILGSLGAGGMGEVYRARDTKLGRDVALKILPADFQLQPERRARFGREARTLASLNHPHIAQVHGFEEAGETSALVMELVEGEDLSQRIRRGPIPYADAIAIARQVGQALEAAHEQGIVHRDLKPANIKVRDDGTVKVLDFGLAKAIESGAAGTSSPSLLANSPTITNPAGVTMGGVILGTAAYMAPEQAKGRAVDKRADIWAFGCVLYEMLTGRQAFVGEDVSETLASVLKSDVNWNGVPPQARRLLGRCLERDPRRRLHDIADAWDLLDDASTSIASTPAKRQWLPWLIAGAFLASTVAVVLMRTFEPRVGPRSARFQLEPPPNHLFEIYVTLSPDGRRLAYTATDQNRIVSLWVRDLESLNARQLPGTEGAASPFWSPDGRYLAFGVGPTLRKADIEGGVVQKIADSQTNVGLGAWNRDGAIVFGARGLGPLQRVSAGGGTPVAVTHLDESRVERGHSFPVFLPDQKRFLYIRLTGRPENQGVYVGSIDKPAAEQDPALLVATTLGPVAVMPTPAGHRLLYIREGTLVSQPFDVDRLKLSGDPQPLAEHIGSTGSFGYFGVGGDVLAFRTGQATATNLEQLTWMGRGGETLGKLGAPLLVSGGENALAIAPDGLRAAVTISQTLSPDVWLVEFARAIVTRFTFAEGPDTSPAWSPDSRRIAFRTEVTGGDIVAKDVDGTAEGTPLASRPEGGQPTSWSPDGRFLVFSRNTAATTADLWALSVQARTATQLMQTPFAETGGRLSPDGRWLAYTSTESGTPEVYIRAFTVSADGKPSVGSKWRVSTSGGSTPRWRADGQELFYRLVTGDIMAVDVQAGENTVQTTLPRKLFAPVGGVHAWDVMPDGQRFLVSVPLSSQVTASPNPITVVLNWQSMLTK